MGGYPPFQADNHRALFRKVRAGDFVFHNKYFGSVSIIAKRLISNLLTVNVSKRWTAQEALDSDWFRVSSSKDLQSHDLTNSLASLKQFNARQRWRSAAGAVRWATTARFWTSDKVSFQQQLLNWDKDVLRASAMATSDTTSATTTGITGNETNLCYSAPPVPCSLGNTSLLGKLPRIRFEDVYELKQEVRKGSCATIWEARHRVTDEIYAVKTIQRNKLQPSDDQVVLNEVAILQSLSDNTSVVQLMDFYEEDDAFYLVMEYMNGGDVFDRLVTLTLYTEQDARDLAVRLLKAVAKLHKVLQGNTLPSRRVCRDSLSRYSQIHFFVCLSTRSWGLHTVTLSPRICF